MSKAEPLFSTSHRNKKSKREKPDVPGYGIRVADESVNKFALIGDCLICEVVRPNTRRASLDAELVHLRRERNGLAVEMVWMATMQRDGALRFNVHSTDPRYRSFVAFYPSKDPDEKVTILGRVTGRYRSII